MGTQRLMTRPSIDMRWGALGRSGPAPARVAQIWARS